MTPERRKRQVGRTGQIIGIVAVGLFVTVVMILLAASAASSNKSAGHAKAAADSVREQVAITRKAQFKGCVRGNDLRQGSNVGRWMSFEIAAAAYHARSIEAKDANTPPALRSSYLKAANNYRFVATHATTTLLVDCVKAIKHPEITQKTTAFRPPTADGSRPMTEAEYHQALGAR